jgi:hypothetical protein
MFDIREIKNKVPSYKEFGRLKQSGCQRNYDTAAPVITPLTSFEWKRVYQGMYAKIHRYGHNITPNRKNDVFDPVCFTSRVINGRDLKPWKEVYNGA